MGRVGEPLTVVTDSPEATRCWGQRLAALLAPGDVVLLEGELGAGKTTFTQGMADGLGVEGPVTSPSFTLAHEYRGRLSLYHLDLYRLDDPSAMAEVGLDEYLEQDAVAVVEWAEKLGPFVPEAHLRIAITYGQDENQRQLKFYPQGGRYAAMVEELRRFAGAGA